MRNRDATYQARRHRRRAGHRRLASVIYGVVNTTTHGGDRRPRPSPGSSPGRRCSRRSSSGRPRSRRTRSCPFDLQVAIALDGQHHHVPHRGAFFAMWYFLTYYFQYVLGYGPVKAGLRLLARWRSPSSSAPRSEFATPLEDRRAPAAPGRAVLATLGFLWISLIKTDSSYWAHILSRPSSAPSRWVCSSPLATAATSGVDRADAGTRLGGPQHRAPGRRLARARHPRHRRRRTSTNTSPPRQPSALVDGYQRAFEISGAYHPARPSWSARRRYLEIRDAAPSAEIIQYFTGIYSQDRATATSRRTSGLSSRLTKHPTV
jgi:hypothetical protein